MARQAEAERERRAKVIHASGNKKPPPRSHPARRITIRPEPAHQFGSAVNLRVALLGTYPPTQCGLATYLASTRSVLAWARPAWSMPVIRVLGSAAAGPQAAPGVVATWRPGCRSSLFEAAYEIATTECPCWCGLTVPHEDPVAMSEAIGSIVADPVRARQMSPCCASRRSTDALVCGRRVNRDAHRQHRQRSKPRVPVPRDTRSRRGYNRRRDSLPKTQSPLKHHVWSVSRS